MRVINTTVLGHYPLMLLSCVTTGMHYFADVLGELIVTAIVILATRPLNPAFNALAAKTSIGAR
jgi:hypothetical protein